MTFLMYTAWILWAICTVILKATGFLLIAASGVALAVSPVIGMVYLARYLHRRRLLKRAIVSTLVVAMVMGGTAVSRAQIPVTDVLALTQHITEVVLQETIKVVRQTQAELTYKMSLRLSQWVSLEDYYIHRDNMPEWRIHNWFTDDVLYAKPFNYALTYGDTTGEGVASVTVPLADAAPVLAADYTPEAKAILRTYLASIQAMDSGLVRGTHVAGQHRFAGRAEAEAIIQYQDMVTDEDLEQSLAAKLDHVAAGKIVGLQNQQARAAMLTALLEQLALEGLFERETDAAVNNMILTSMTDADGEGARPGIVDHADEAIRNWRIR